MLPATVQCTHLASAAGRDPGEVCDSGNSRDAVLLCWSYVVAWFDSSCHVQLASAKPAVESLAKRRTEGRGDVYSGVDLEELSPSCWTPVDTC